MARMREEEIAVHVKRMQKLIADRGTFDSHCQEIAEVIYPEYANFTFEGTPGEKRMSKVYDSTGIHANQLLSAGLFSLLTSSANPWFEIRPVYAEDLENREIALYLAIVSRCMYHELNKASAGFVTAMHEGYLSYGAFGNMTIFVDESLEQESLSFLSLPLYECYYVQNKQDRVTTLYRKYKRTVEQLVLKFEKERLSEATQKLADDNKIDQPVECTHIIMPRESASLISPRAVDAPYASAYIEMKEKHLINESGFRELPFMASRFYKSSHEVYGRGPGHSTLPDVKMLMRVAQVTIRAAQKTTDPSLLLPDIGFLKPLRTTPGGLNFYRKGRVNLKTDIGELPSGNPGIGLEYAQSLHERIREAFYVDQLQLSQGPQMTATEVLQRTEEKLRLMGPLLGRVQTELLGPLIERVYGLLQRSGRFPEPPESLHGLPLKIVYTSPIARAQEQVQANGLARMFGVLQPIMELKPDMLDIFNTDEITRGTAEMFSINPKFLNAQKDVDKKRAADAKAAQDRMDAENLKDKGAGLKSVAEAAGAATELDLTDLAEQGQYLQ